MYDSAGISQGKTSYLLSPGDELQAFCGTQLQKEDSSLAVLFHKQWICVCLIKQTPADAKDT